MIRFLIPAYNEAENLPALFDRIASAMARHGWGFSILIVNDGSRDATLDVIAAYQDKLPITVVSHESNDGVDAVFRTGFQHVIQGCADEDIVITMEADNTSDVDIMEHMIAKIEAGDDLVLASCYAKDGGVEGTTRLRVFLSSGANILLKTFFPIKGISTYSSFYRAYRGAMLKEAFGIYGNDFIEEKGFVCMVEMLIKFHRLNIKISEEPMILRGNMRQGQSKMKIIHTVIGYLDVIRRNLFRKNWKARKDS